MVSPSGTGTRTFAQNDVLGSVEMVPRSQGLLVKQQVGSWAEARALEMTMNAHFGKPFCAWLC